MTKGKGPDEVRLQRHFIPDTFTVTNTASIRPYFLSLLEAEIHTVDEARQWLDRRSELAYILEEELAWRYIHMNRHTDNETYNQAYEYYVTQLEPQIVRWSNQLDKKWLSLPFAKELQNPAEKILTRQLINRHELFCEANVPVLSRLQVLEQEYGKVVAAMTVEVENEERTLPQAANLLRSSERKIREETFRKISNRRLADKERLQQNFNTLISLRTELAYNAGYKNYRDYRFRELGRFDYTVEACLDFHKAIATLVVPMVDQLNRERREQMQVDELRPYDLDADPLGRPPLQAFNDIGELIGKAVQGFTNIDPRFGRLLDDMSRHGFLDLGSRKNKAPGGFNYPLYESNIPFIFMNATGNLRDVETLFHEGGHAVHSFLSSSLAWIENKELPPEIAELASMSMELISTGQWYLWFPDGEALRRARREQLEGIIRILPWIAAIDSFQHRLYTHPGHTPQERNETWLSCMKEFGSAEVSWKGYEEYLAHYWQTQLHLFEAPFYYIEYGIAQIGALGIWRNYRQDPSQALEAYKDALALGYSRTIPEVYEAAAIQFDFSLEYIRDIMQFLQTELETLKG